MEKTLEPPDLENLASKRVDILLDEYKAHQDSYNSLRGQYLTFLTIVIIAIGTLDAAILNPSTPPSSGSKQLLVISVFVVLFAMVAAHIVGLRGIYQSRDRLIKIEEQLGIEPYDTTWQLRVAVWTTLAANTAHIFIHRYFYLFKI